MTVTLDTPGPVIERACDMCGQPVDVPVCQCGCGRPVGIAKVTNPRRGYVKGKPFKYLRGHAPGAYGPEYIITAAGCWEWQRAISRKDGYGRLQRHGRRLLAHRDYYERHIGRIPDGFQLDHLCRNRACVNPAHLEPVTNAENARRAARTKLSPEDAATIRTSKEDSRVVAARYGIARSTVYSIRNGWSWKAK